MSATPNDIRMYDRCIQIATDHSIGLAVTGESFQLVCSDGSAMGRYSSVESMYIALCAYEVGFCKGKWTKD